MRVLLLFRGSAGCGKSTYIKEHGLKPFTLSPDDIRLMCSSPSLNINGKLEINQKNDKRIWEVLFDILETRMNKGEFTVIDATNSKTSEMIRYKKLADIYRYRIYCIDMTDIPIEEKKRRNAQREEIKRVPDEVIDKFYARFKTQKIPSGIKVLKPDELNNITYKISNMNEYNKIHVIGDIHGCYTVLQEYINDKCGGIKDDEFYIFLGDYIDRGIENAEVIKYFCELCKRNNVYFIEGNHERSLWNYVNDIPSNSREFELHTKEQLIEAKISKKDIKNFYRKLGQCSYFMYNDNIFLVTHGGLSKFPEELLFISTEQMIRGTGDYDDSNLVDESFTKLSFNNIYQVHGHRNIYNSPIHNTEKTYNLEGGVELGGCLRAIQITKNGIDEFEIKNTVYRKENEMLKNKQDETLSEQMATYNLVNEMRLNKNIYEKKYGNISSFNFSQKAFHKGIWDGITNKARGLFIDTNRYKVVARSYDKFFNIGENTGSELSMLRLKLQFPVVAYVKYNGFLGIVGYDVENDELLITSKSNPKGMYAKYFRDILYSYGEETINKMKSYIKENNVSFIFECIDIENDPHIIQYQKSKVVLLDIIKNQLKYEKLPYGDLIMVAKELNFEVKELAYMINDYEEFCDWINIVSKENYKYNGKYIEGFVFEDITGYMLKLKLYYYRVWKHMRNVVASISKYGYYKYTQTLLTPIENEFYGWYKTMYDKAIKEGNKKHLCTNIIQLRNMFMDYYHDVEMIE